MPDFDYDKVLYKYRGFENFEFALDIFINERLYAADFKTLNDPMEGRFRYGKSVYDKQTIREVIMEKADYRILSLSELRNNHLLWSYYAGGHGGFAVGVQIIPDDNLLVKEVNYVEDFHVDVVTPENILTMKHETWQHENEFRVLQRKYNDHSPFVKVRIKELVFGKNTSQQNESKMNLLSELVRKILPDVSILTIKNADIAEWIEAN